MLGVDKNVIGKAQLVLDPICQVHPILMDLPSKTFDDICYIRYLECSTIWMNIEYYCCFQGTVCS